MGFRAGAAQVVITPPVGVELAGYGFGPSAGILGDLLAQALVLEGPAQLVAIVTADLLGFDARLVERVRERVQARWGIPADGVLLAGSHTHSGPAAGSLRQWGVMDPRYVAVLEDQLVALVGVAQRDLREATVGYGVGRAEKVAENRRVAGGPVDTSLPVLRVSEASGEPIAVLYDVGCHPVTLHSYRNMISPDYPGYARMVVRDVLGSEVVVLFLLGGAGDVNPLGYVAGETTPQRSRQIGAMVGCEVARVALGLETRVPSEICVARRTVELPVEPLPPTADLCAMRDRCAEEAVRLRVKGAPVAEVSVAEIKRDWARDALAVQEAGSAVRARPCELQGLRLDEWAVVAMPLEVFVETTLAIKEASPASVTVLCSNANGGVGYLPTREAYEGTDYTNPQGLAPKVYGLYALSPGAEPLVRQGAGALLRSLF